MYPQSCGQSNFRPVLISLKLKRFRTFIRSSSIYIYVYKLRYRTFKDARIRCASSPLRDLPSGNLNTEIISDFVLPFAPSINIVKIVLTLAGDDTRFPSLYFLVRAYGRKRVHRI